MVTIDEYYTISCDAHCWTLQYEKQKGVNEKTGKPIVRRRQSYHGTFEQAIKKYADEKLKENVYDDAAHDTGLILDELRSIKDTIEKLSEKIGVSGNFKRAK